MKTKSKSRHVLGSSGFFLVLLFSSAARVNAEDQASDGPAVQTKEEETVTKSEDPMRTDIIRNSAGLVGPSGEEIHDFFYPTAKDDTALTRAN